MLGELCLLLPFAVALAVFAVVALTAETVCRVRMVGLFASDAPLMVLAPLHQWWMLIRKRLSFRVMRAVLAVRHEYQVAFSVSVQTIIQAVFVAMVHVFAAIQFSAEALFHNVTVLVNPSLPADADLNLNVDLSSAVYEPSSSYRYSIEFSGFSQLPLSSAALCSPFASGRCARPFLNLTHHRLTLFFDRFRAPFVSWFERGLGSVLRHFVVS